MFRAWMGGTGALVAATMASACCIGPVLLVGLGAGALGIGAAFAPFRPYFLLLTALLLGFAFWRAYRPQRTSGEDCCQTSSPGKGKVDGLRKALLWAVTGLTLLAAAFPALQARFRPAPDAYAGETSPAGETSVVLAVKGMTCTGCEITVERELTAVPGVERVEVSYMFGEAIVHVEEDAPKAEALIKAVERAGYEATVKSPNEKD